MLRRLSNLNDSTRLKVNRDSFFIPDPNGGVYFRNNLSSFRMEGSSIYQWIEKLIPMFNGEHSLKSLTDGLPVEYRNRVFEIGEILYKNGFVRDVSKDHPHQLTDNILKKYASQIEFLNSFGDSGAYRFESYRQAKVLAIGSGSIVISLVSALLESGISKFTLLITDNVDTNRKRIKELVGNARKVDLEVEVNIIKRKGKSWQEVVAPFDSILYVSEEDDVEELRSLNSICKNEKKRFIPSICSNRIGLAGPVVNSNSEGCFESAWRSIHQKALSEEEKLQPSSSIASAMLTNLIVFELFKDITKSNDSEKHNQFYLINQESLEGNWHTFTPHPLVTGNVKTEFVQDFDLRLKQNTSRGEQSKLFHYLGQLTSEEAGIFHIWDEGDLKQLPLAQCRIQVVDLYTEGPANLLPSIICSDLTHEEARREAALTGIEMYASQIAHILVKDLVTVPPEIESSLVDAQEFIAIGTGETFSECICRGLQKCLSEELSKQISNQVNSVREVNLSIVEDERAQFYLKALTIIHGVPKIALGEEVFGFPVVWVGTNDRWYRSVGLSKTMALREALKQALMETQNKANHISQAFDKSSILLEEKKSLNLIIPACNGIKQAELLMSAMKILEQNNKQIETIELMLELFKVEELAGVYGVLLREV